MLSLVTGTLRRPRQLDRLIQSVLSRTRVPFELVISDASDETSGSIDPRVMIHSEKPRLGHVRGYNRAFRMCRGEWILWLNDDAEVLDGYDTEAIAFMEAHPKIGLGALHYSENGGPFHVNSAYGALYANFGIFRRSLGERLGFFDEDFRMYGADNAFTFQVLLAGYGIADIPGARLLHHSENDQVRADNQKGRPSDNRMLEEKYLPKRAQWLATYNRCRVQNDTRAWSHGRRPVGVVA